MIRYRHLTESQREVISLRVASGASQTDIALEIGCHKSTVSREIRRNRRASGCYTSQSAQRKAGVRRKREYKLGRDPQALQFVIQRLSEGWSPEAISGHLRRGVEDIAYVCHEAIYSFIYSAGQAKAKLWRYLVRARSKRKSRGVRASKTRIAERVSIHERPENVNDRNEIGHWESDYVICKHHQPLLVIHERKTRLTLAMKLTGRSAAETISVLTAQFKKIGKSFRATLTLDNDLGFALHHQLTTMLGIDTYFCDAYASWQKGGVENANGRLRRWIPKGADLSKYSDEDIDEINMKMNLIPRKCLGWKTPLQVWAEQANRDVTIKFA